MASNVYNKGVLKLLNGTIDYLNDNIAIMIMDETYSFDSSHEFVSNVTGEITGTGYARKSLVSKTVELNANSVIFDCGTIEYTALDSTDTLASAIIYAESGTDSTSSLIANIDFVNLSVTNSDVNVVTSDQGLFKVTNSFN